MATTAFGVNHPLAVKLWSEKLFREALKETYIGKFIGTGSNSLIQQLTETQRGAGDTIYVGLRMQLAGAGISGDSTLEGNEEALTFYRDSVVIDQLRNAVRSSGKMSEQRVPYNMREEARMALSDWMADAFDTGFFNQVTGYDAETDTKRTGMQSATAASTGRKIMGGGSESTEASLSATTTQCLTLRDLDRCVAIAKTASPMIRPIRIGGEDRYVCFIHPYQTYQLRAQTNTAQWADIQKAAMQGGQISNNPIFTGALGMYNGVILHESTRIPTASGNAAPTSFRRAVFCGAQAGLLAFGQGQSGLRASWVEEVFDYGNQLGVSGGAIWGLKKSIYNSVDFSTITISGYAPAVS